ncbi:MAG: hypothetical protein V4510_12150 [bacterium]
MPGETEHERVSRVALNDWLPATMRAEPRAADTRLTGVRIPYDRETCLRVIAKGEPKGSTYEDFGAVLRWKHATAMLVYWDRDRLIDDARD